jgi:DHA2 family multidrug resistance protein
MHHEELIKNLSPYSPVTDLTLHQLNATGISLPQQANLMNLIVDQQAYTMAATDLFRGSAILFLVLVTLIWLAKPVKPSSSEHSK